MLNPLIEHFIFCEIFLVLFTIKLDGIASLITPKKNINLSEKNKNWNVTRDIWQITCDTRHFTCDTWHMTFKMWHVTGDTWLVTHDLWQMTHDIWHMKHDRWREVNIPSKFQLSSSYGLGVMLFWKFGGKELLSY